MKKSVLIYFMILAGGIICLGFLAGPAQAQDVEKVEEMQRVIELQQQQLEAQQKQLDAQKEFHQKQLDAQRKLLQQLQKQIQSLAKDADTPTEKDADMSKDKAVVKLPT
jgi:Skp family chaperone for outer membrane proteins